MQTAEIVAAAVKHRGRVMVNYMLVPEGTVSNVVAFLRSAAGEKGVALVAHEPILLGGRRRAHRSRPLPGVAQGRGAPHPDA